MKKSLSIFLLSLTLVGLSTPAHAVWSWSLIAIPWEVTSGDDDDTPPPHVVPSFTPGDLWLTADDIDLSDIPDTAHPSHTAREVDSVFDYLENKYPDHLPSHQTSYYNQGYRVRYYPDSDGYLYEYAGDVRFSNKENGLAVETLDKWAKLLIAEREEDIEVVFDWLEESYPDQFPSHQESYYEDGETNNDRARTRYYPRVDGYLTVKNKKITSSNDSDNIGSKTLDQWLKIKKDQTRVEIDLVFDWMEKSYPHFFPSKQKSYYKDGHRTRYYPSKDGYICIDDDNEVAFSKNVALTGISHLENWAAYSGVTADLSAKANAPTLKKDELIESDLVFDWLEENYSSYFPSHQQSFNKDGYWTRYYPSIDGYLFVKNSIVDFSRNVKFTGTSALDSWVQHTGVKVAPGTEDDPSIKDSVFPVTDLRMATKSQINSLYDWFEENFPEHFPSHQSSYEWLDGYWTRYYPSTQSYLSSKNGYVYFSDNIKDEMGSDSLDDWFEFSGVAKEEEYRLTDLLFNWIEKEYSHYLSSHQVSYNDEGVRTRYYPSDDSYLFVENGDVHLHRYGGDEKEEVFSLEVWLNYSRIAADEKSGEDKRVEAQRL